MQSGTSVSCVGSRHSDTGGNQVMRTPVMSTPPPHRGNWTPYSECLLPCCFLVVSWWFCFVRLSSYLLRLSINSLCFLCWVRTPRIFISHLNCSENQRVLLLEMTEGSPGCPFHTWGNWGPETLSGLSKTTGLLSGVSEARTSAPCVLILYSPGKDNHMLCSGLFHSGALALTVKEIASEEGFCFCFLFVLFTCW